MAAQAPSANGGGAANICQLPYPDRFHAAAKFLERSPPGAKKYADAHRLLLYALQQQATKGPCIDPAPWGWNVVENAKYQSWRQLKDMHKMEAMRLFVRTIEEEQPDWWALLEAAPEEMASLTGEGGGENGEADGGSAEAGAAAADPGTPALLSLPADGAWIMAPMKFSGRQPTPRYEHAAVLVGPHMFIVGGSSSGRYLSDVWMLNLSTLEYESSSLSAPKASTPPPSSAPAGPTPPPPTTQPLPCAAHAMVRWRGSVLSIGGHSKNKDPKAPLEVRQLNRESLTWTTLECNMAGGGETPRTRGGHTATLLGDKVYVFGGETPARVCLDDLWVLHLPTMTWSRCHPGARTRGAAPSGRSAHSAAAVGKNVIVWGGGSVAHCFNELHVLDTEANEWYKPEVEGPSPAPRAGHGAALLGYHWYVCGGGNNSSGCRDMWRLDLTPATPPSPLAWEKVAEVPAKNVVASEGMVLLPVPWAGALVCFGGYNGTYHNTLHVYKPPRTGLEPELPSINAASDDEEAAASAPSDDAPALPNAEVAPAADAPPAEAGPSAEEEPTPSPSQPAQSTGPTVAELQQQVEEVRAQKEEAQADAASAREAIAEAEERVVALQAEVTAKQEALDTAERGVESVKTLLSAEQQKTMQLEVKVAELEQKVAAMAELEKEVAKYRTLIEEAQKKNAGGGGLWGFISGQ